MEEIRSETTGKVWKILVVEGTDLEEDDAVMILESMKMEIPVVAPRTGKLLSLLVKEGDPITEGQAVATIE